jgi:hypothetical protein
MQKKYFLGLDLGQAADYTALAVVETTYVGHHHGPYECRAIKRWQLNTPYTQIVADVAALVGKPPLLQRSTEQPRPGDIGTGADRPALAVDATGVGRPVVDMIWGERMPVTVLPVVITGGIRESWADAYFHVPKVGLISRLQVLLEQRKLTFASRMEHAATLVKELQNYRVKITDAANESFNAREGEHDDLILAVALAAWAAERRTSSHIEGELVTSSENRPEQPKRNIFRYGEVEIDLDDDYDDPRSNPWR